MTILELLEGMRDGDERETTCPQSDMGKACRATCQYFISAARRCAVVVNAIAAAMLVATDGGAGEKKMNHEIAPVDYDDDANAVLLDALDKKKKSTGNNKKPQQRGAKKNESPVEPEPPVNATEEELEEI